jgi:hypothetical protein
MSQRGRKLPAYEAREVAFKGVVQVSDMHLKWYEITAPERGGACIEPQWFLQALAGLDDLYKTSEPIYGHFAGFVIAHYARDGNYLLASRWCGSNMLRHRVLGFDISGGVPVDVAPLDMEDIIACVWELEVMRFERDQWVRIVMNDLHSDKEGESVTRYLKAGFSGWA